MSDTTPQSIAGCIRTCECRGCAWRRAQMEKHRTRSCVVCGVIPPCGDFMATDEVWKGAGFMPDQLACFECFIARLARPVTVADFRDCPGNVPLLWALRRLEETLPL